MQYKQTYMGILIFKNMYRYYLIKYTAHIPNHGIVSADTLKGIKQLIKEVKEKK